MTIRHYRLRLNATLDNVDQLVNANGFWYLNISNNDGTQHQRIVLRPAEVHPIPRYPSIFVRWEGTPAVNYVRIDNEIDPAVDGTYPAEQSCQYFPVLVVECRNVVLNSWELARNFNSVSGGETFTEVDLMDGFYSNVRTDGIVADVSYAVTDVVLMDP